MKFADHIAIAIILLLVALACFYRGKRVADAYYFDHPNNVLIQFGNGVDPAGVTCNRLDDDSGYKYIQCRWVKP